MQPAYASILLRSGAPELDATPVADLLVPPLGVPDAAATVVDVAPVPNFATVGDAVLEHAARPTAAAAEAMIKVCASRMSSPSPGRRGQGYATAGYRAGTGAVTSL
jgi:hypothetical protein